MGRRFLILASMLAFLVAADAVEAQGTSRSTFLKLMEVQELWGEDRYDEALAILQELAIKNQGKNYDYAVTQQYIAHTSILADRYDQARPALEKALAVPGLPVKLISQLKLDYGQIVLADEDFELARSLLEDWLATTEEEPRPSQLFSLAYANYMTRNLPRAEVLLERTLAVPGKINNAWFRVYYLVLFEQKKYDKAERVIFGLVSRAPNEELYWRMLSNHFLQLEDSRQALSAFAIAHLQGLLEDPDDLERLASLYNFVEIPEKSARLLEEFVANDVIEEDFEILKRLGDLWLLARHRDKAIHYLGRAAPDAEDGEIYSLLASLYFEDEDWVGAHEAFLKALEAGGFDDEPEEIGRLNLLAGMSAYEAGMEDAAAASFEEAKKTSKYRRQALIMLRRINES